MVWGWESVGRRVSGGWSGEGLPLDAAPTPGALEAGWDGRWGRIVVGAVGGVRLCEWECAVSVVGDGGSGLRSAWGRCVKIAAAGGDGEVGDVVAEFWPASARPSVRLKKERDRDVVGRAE